MREARSGISRAASSPAPSMRSHRLRFHLLGNSGSPRQASATLIPLWWNSQSIPSRSSLVYIPGSLPDREGPIVRPGSRCSENRDHEDQFLVNINIAAASRRECASRCNVVPGMGQREHRQPDTSVLSERHRLTGSTAMTRSPRCTMHSATDPASTSGSGRPRRPTAQKCCTCFENSRIINRRPHRFR